MDAPTATPALGTVIRSGLHSADTIRTLAPHGFETWQLDFSIKRGVVPPLAPLASQVQEALAATGTRISALGIYGNPLRDDATGAESRRALREGIQCARLFGTGIVGCFTGRIPGSSIDASLPRFQEVWSELAREADGCGVRLAFENCLQGGTWDAGDWNMAINPDAWERLFDAVPSPVLGLEWEPAHQMCQLIDPMPQLAQWAPRILHLHGKDANVHHHVIARHGVFGKERFAWHRTPSFGDSDWTEIIRLLRHAGYSGSIDIEGFHDPVYREDRELEGQLKALTYLRHCRSAAS